MPVSSAIWNSKGSEESVNWTSICRRLSKRSTRSYRLSKTLRIKPIPYHRNEHVLSHINATAIHSIFRTMLAKLMVNAAEEAQKPLKEAPADHHASH